jgi:hypothetical protein
MMEAVPVHTTTEADRTEQILRRDVHRQAKGNGHLMPTNTWSVACGLIQIVQFQEDDLGPRRHIQQNGWMIETDWSRNLILAA